MKQSSKWNQKVIEDKLKKMPKIKDKQSKEALYERIQKKLLEDKIKPQKTNKWILSTVATAAVLFLLLLIIPPLFNNEDNFTLEESQDKAGIMMEVNDYPSEDTADTDMAETESVLDERIADDFNKETYLGAAQPFEERQQGEALVTIAVPGSYATGELVIPITLHAQGLSQLDKFSEVKNSFSGEYWGIGSFPSIQINSITEESAEVVVLDFTTGSLASISSAEDNLYKQVLKETFTSLGYNEIKFTSDNDAGVDWGQEGPLYAFDISKVNRGYYLFESKTKHQFLVRGRTVEAPRSTDEQASFQEILLLMKSGDIGKGYHASISEEVVITKVEQTEGTATITFAEGAIVEDKAENLIMLEAIMFTAKDFGIKFIKFEGLEIEQVGPYKIGDVIKIPDFINFIR